MKRYTNSQIEHLIDEYIHDEKHREIMKRRLMDHWTYERIAEHVDLTPRRIASLVPKLLLELNDLL